MTLGTYPAISLAQAREAWRKARQDVAAGRDPAKVRNREASGTDFESVAREWLKRDQGKNKSVREVERVLVRELLPAWGHRSVAEISRRDVRDLIDGIAGRGAPIMAPAKELGERLGLTNTEREALKLWPFLPIDKTEEELAEQAKARERERRARKRREKGVRTREAYLAELASQPKPWTVQGISRSAYYRKRTRDELSPRLRRGESEIIVFKERTHVVSPNVGDLRKEGHQRGVSGESPKQITREAKRAETKASSSPELRTNFVSINSRLAALENWGAAAKGKINP